MGVPLRPFSLVMAMISASPAASAVTRPWGLTEATSGALELQVTSWLPAGLWAKDTFAFNCRVFPTGRISGPAGVRVRSVT